MLFFSFHFYFISLLFRCFFLFFFFKQKTAYEMRISDWISDVCSSDLVCGAPNARAGLIGVFGPPGAFVPGGGFELKVAAIRGVTSNGMMCSARELEIGEGHEGIIELPEDALVGTAYPDYAGLHDPVIDVSITPKRQDCMGGRGVANGRARGRARV